MRKQIANMHTSIRVHLRCLCIRLPSPSPAPCEPHPKPQRAAGEMQSLEGLRELRGEARIPSPSPPPSTHQVRAAQGELLLAGGK